MKINLTCDNPGLGKPGILDTGSLLMFTSILALFLNGVLISSLFECKFWTGVVEAVEALSRWPKINTHSDGSHCTLFILWCSSNYASLLFSVDQLCRSPLLHHKMHQTKLSSLSFLPLTLLLPIHNFIFIATASLVNLKINVFQAVSNEPKSKKIHISTK